MGYGERKYGEWESGDFPHWLLMDNSRHVLIMPGFTGRALYRQKYGRRVRSKRVPYISLFGMPV